MDLILWRHAQAEAGEPDEGRELTQQGRKQAQRMGAWLDRTLPSGCKILSSPTCNSLQRNDGQTIIRSSCRLKIKRLQH